MEIKRKIIIILIIGLSSILFAGESVIRVQKGDTLYKISRENNVSVSLLLSFNGLENANSLKIGQEIRIPSSYTVSKGDTLYGIARQAGIEFNELCKINGIDKNHLLKPGELLILPVESSEIVEKTDVTVPVNIINDEKPYTEFFWPHSGERVSMIGKLKGEEILGSKGDQIVSVSTGKVVWVAPYRGYGQLIMVESIDHHIFAYGGNEETLVKVGDPVYPGTALGLMGINSIERNAKAFFFVYKDGKPVDINKAPRR
ncbi:MAG: M23 family metallopeptidase [Spirochaetia bacterium]|jgi:LysM repeat protein|nr:M23 family metallopeptidase [Spirochaetia bacterium]